MPKSKEQFAAIKLMTAEKIERAGLKLFAQKGLGATSIQEIAQEAGISMGLMYHYYKSKEDLYVNLVKAAVFGANEALSQLQKKRCSPRKKIELFSEDIVNELKKEDAVTPYYFSLMTQAMLNQQLPSAAEEYIDKASESLSILKSIIKKGQRLGEIKKGDASSLTLMYMSVYLGLCSYKLMGRDFFAVPEASWINDILIIYPNSKKRRS